MDAVIFDLGNVLIPWDLRYLYDKVIGDVDRREQFLSTVLTPDANARLDAGTPLPEVVADLTVEHPEWSDELSAFEQRWIETIGEPIEGTVEILEELVDRGQRCLALSNWGRDTFAMVRKRFGFLDLFEDMVISGREGIVKPSREIFDLMTHRHGLIPNSTVFIDDSEANIKTADVLGFDTIRFTSPTALREDLEARSLL